ncbi:Uncharacterized protein PHPALM_3466 [Phytophthora palmivora]|uniref:Reverse transcriptase RNase H-like domain-containing protein n=1 Tax=Phytophthora palmivora TaxID=4796 RepID=A0A2P4YMA0_9STRA|nr:Uncharacterized protein PHPALM_3466 [Phytophthora palmivora]
MSIGNGVLKKNSLDLSNASTVGLGACFMPDHGQSLQPVVYASKVNSVAESKYVITNLECLAVV